MLEGGRRTTARTNWQPGVAKQSRDRPAARCATAPSGLAGGLFGPLDRRPKLEPKDSPARGGFPRVNDQRELTAGSRPRTIEAARGQQTEARRDRPTVAEEPHAAKRLRPAKARECDHGGQVARPGSIAEAELALHIPANFPLLGYLQHIRGELRAVVAEREPLIPPSHFLDEPRDTAEPEPQEALEILGVPDEPPQRSTRRPSCGLGLRPLVLSPEQEGGAGKAGQEELLALPPHMAGHGGDQAAGGRGLPDKAWDAPPLRRTSQRQEQRIVRSPARPLKAPHRSTPSPRRTSQLRHRLGGESRSLDQPARGNPRRGGHGSPPPPRLAIEDSPDTGGAFFNRARVRSNRRCAWESPAGGRAESPPEAFRGRSPLGSRLSGRLGSHWRASLAPPSRATGTARELLAIEDGGVENHFVSSTMVAGGLAGGRAQRGGNRGTLLDSTERSPREVNARNWDFTSDLAFLTSGGV